MAQVVGEHPPEYTQQAVIDPRVTEYLGEISQAAAQIPLNRHIRKDNLGELTLSRPKQGNGIVIAERFGSPFVSQEFAERFSLDRTVGMRYRLHQDRAGHYSLTIAHQIAYPTRNVWLPDKPATSFPHVQKVAPLFLRFAIATAKDPRVDQNAKDAAQSAAQYFGNLMMRLSIEKKVQHS